MVNKVAETLREAHCGRQNSQPLVLCNEEEEEEEETLDPQNQDNLIRMGYGLIMSNVLYIDKLLFINFQLQKWCVSRNGGKSFMPRLSKTCTLEQQLW